MSNKLYLVGDKKAQETNSWWAMTDNETTAQALAAHLNASVIQETEYDERWRLKADESN